jgi:TM2 domain-containing membrane protein YozV
LALRPGTIIRMDYFIAVGGVQQGPFPIDQLLSRGLKPDTLVWRSGMAQWQRADSVAELQSLFPPPPPRQGNSSASGSFSSPNNPSSSWQVPPVEPVYVPGSSRRVLVGVLALFFGGLGIHKFALGMISTGLVMLITSVCVSFFTFGLGYVVMHAIGIVEGIIYLSKSDAEFERTYVIGKRHWF